MLIQILTVLLSGLVMVLCQGQSPCPDILEFEPRNKDELDRWYGVVSLKTTEDLEGVWLKIALDRSVELLGNWFGETTSSDNIEFSIRNPKYRLEAGPPVSVRFFVKYNAATIVPTVKKILLNGKTICPNTKSSAGQTLHISQPSRTGGPSGTVTSTTRRAITKFTASTASSINQQEYKRPHNPQNNENIEDEDDEDDTHFFPGDFPAGPTRRPSEGRPTGGQPKAPGCGTIATRANPLISHGQNTTPGQWPWHVALYYSKGVQIMYTCGGTLISDSHILTAAHCVTRPQTNRAVNKKYLRVYLGKYNLVTFGPEVQDRDVDQIFVHPQYNYSVYFNDIAILKLSRPAEINNFVRPCCLWEGNSELESIIGQHGTVVGWGFDENRQLSKNLMQAQMPIISTVTCIYSNRDFFSQFTFEKNYCAGFRNGTSVCNGDSGGGMVFPKSGTRGQNTIWQLRGIVSVGVALQGQGVCDPSHYIVFTDVAKHLTWLSDVLNQ